MESQTRSLPHESVVVVVALNAKSNLSVDKLSYSAAGVDVCNRSCWPGRFCTICARGRLRSGLRTWLRILAFLWVKINQVKSIVNTLRFNFHTSCQRHLPVIDNNQMSRDQKSERENCGSWTLVEQTDNILPRSKTRV